MATAGDGASGGAGGKFRKNKPFRRSYTPYDRPPIALRNPSITATSNNTNGLFSKLVDPASKLIYAGAHRLFGVFRKRLPPPPPAEKHPPETDQEPMKDPPERLHNNSAAVPELSRDQNGDLDISDATEISELERMLKQNTFTRSEIEHLVALLHARTEDLPAEGENIRDKATPSTTSNIFMREASTESLLNKSKDERSNVNGIMMAPVVTARVIEEDVATPAELAKAYMGSRPAKLSSRKEIYFPPSVLGSHSHLLKQDSSLLSNAITLQSTPVVPKSASNIMTPENGFITPRSRGRSAIYSMTRVPYSRVPPMGTKAEYGYGGASSSLSSPQTAWDQDRAFGSKQMVLKRRSSVLDDDIGSVGPMRRIRQKPNLLSQRSYLSTRGREYGSSSVQHPVLSTQKLLAASESDKKVSKAIEGNGDTSTLTPSFSSVPPKSAQMATKILEHLERLSPKKLSDSTPLVIREKSPTKLTPNMLHGQALRSLEIVNSKLFPSIQDSPTSDALCSNLLPDNRDSTSQSKDKAEGSGLRKFVVPRNMLTPTNGDATVSSRENGLNVKAADSTVAEPPQKKRAFQMSAHEDSMEMDDDNHSNGLVSAPVAEGEKQEKSVVVSKAVSTQALPQIAKAPELAKAQAPPELAKAPVPLEVAKTPALVEVSKAPALPEVSNIPVLPEAAKSDDSITPLTTKDSGAFGGSAVCVGKNGLPSPTSSPLSTTSKLDSHSQSTAISDKVPPPKESNAFPAFGMNPQNFKKVPPFVFSANVPTGFPSNAALSDSKPENFTSLSSVNPVSNNDKVTSVISSDGGDKDKTQKSVDVVSEPKSLSSVVAAPTSTKSTTIFGISAKNSNVTNVTLSPFSFPSPAPFLDSNNNSNQTFGNNLSHVASSVSTDAKPSITTSADSGSGAAPMFSFVSSLHPPAKVSTAPPTSVAENIDAKAKFEKKPTSSSTNSSVFGGTSFSMPSTGSNFFTFSSAATTSIGNNHATQTSLVTAGIGAQTSTATQGIFGGSVVTSSSTLGTSMFSSSNLAPVRPFGSSSSFGLSSPFPSSESNSGSSTGAASTTSVFASNWQQSPKSTVFGSTFSSPSSGFSFGGTTSLTSTSSSPIVFGATKVAGASTGSSMFSFTTAATSPFPSLSQTQPVFGNTGLFGTSTLGNTSSDQMTIEDTMAEDTMQAPTPVVPSFGQSPAAQGFMFSSTPMPPATTFQFGGQANPSAAQNLVSPFQASSSADFSNGGSFSLGSGGGEKSNRKIVRVSKSRNRKK